MRKSSYSLPVQNILTGRSPRFWLLAHVLLASAIFLIFISKIVVRFDGPLVGYADTENWEYTGYYILRMLKFNPLPVIDMDNNIAFYPYGVKQLFLPWCPERDYFYAVFRNAFGLGPWLQIYFAWSKLLIGLGSFLLLRRDFGWKKALASSYLLLLFDFYTMHKWPGHVSQSIHHWVILGIIVDFILVRRFHIERRLDVRFISLRFLLALLSMGLDLGYVAGYGLLSLTVVTAWIISLFGWRMIAGDPMSRSSMMAEIREDMSAAKTTIIITFTLSLIPALLYVPIVYQISTEALAVHQETFNALTWYSSPLRLFVPMLRRFHPFKSPFEGIFNDRPEGLGAGSPGLFLLVLAAIGLWHDRKNIRIYLPFLTIFAIFLFHNPDHFPIVNIFPWSKYARVASRFTSMYPVLLIIFATGVNWRQMFGRRIRYATAMLVIYGAVEMRDSYKMHQDYSYSPNQNFYSYMNTLKDLPGEAVLDWPFCIWDAGTNDSMCPYIHRISGTYALRRFHEKKVIGQFFGRLAPGDTRPLIDAGWDKMFHPPDHSQGLAMRETACFSEAEWKFFDDFFRTCDFAAINLYSDIIADGCRDEFVKRYGEPVARAILPVTGKMELFASNRKVDQKIDIEKCRSLRLDNYR